MSELVGLYVELKRPGGAALLQGRIIAEHADRVLVAAEGHLDGKVRSLHKTLLFSDLPAVTIFRDSTAWLKANLDGSGI
jgi:hypothetical protein